MAVKIIGNDEDVKKYREFLDAQGIYSKSNHPVYKEKPEDFHILQGEITQYGYKTKSNGTWKKAKIDPDAKLYIKGIANARIMDRMDEIVEPAGGQFENFNKNPILLKDHMYWCNSIVGQVISLSPEFDGLHFEAWVGDPQSAPLTEDQKDVRSKIAQGILKTVSIGFIPIEIKAPTFDNQGRMLTPAVILKWEMLELSLVAVPCNAGATFEMRSCAENQISLNKNKENAEIVLTENIQKTENILKVESTTVQTLIFDKEKFTVEQAKKWARDHDFKDDSVDETEDSIRLRQRDPGDFIEGSFRTIELTDGVKAVIGRLKDDLDMEKKLDELIDGIKSISTLLTSVSSQIEKSLEMNVSILGKFEEKKKPCDEEEKVTKPDEEKPDEEETEDDEEMKKSFQSIRDEIAEIKSVIKAIIEKI
jgi:hypothetical protein